VSTRLNRPIALQRLLVLANAVSVLAAFALLAVVLSGH